MALPRLLLSKRVFQNTTSFGAEKVSGLAVESYGGRPTGQLSQIGFSADSPTKAARQPTSQPTPLPANVGHRDSAYQYEKTWSCRPSWSQPDDILQPSSHSLPATLLV
ncbi:uncharacterized protein CIMG_13604 [Coccidioides immitis RS]|uniref:Uncharacterized protein n=1 Tax=Coccidioides immitis (strain RS) TaxID=246410 RepID=A0A0D8JW62_COCIM|nr:uncharacterized protein CIMG_13604 [Coccidioides immitis RS]KJF61364.1 hypothetical protein CIMG_13604 [Coccidioides immitis RS]